MPAYLSGCARISLPTARTKYAALSGEENAAPACHELAPNALYAAAELMPCDEVELERTLLMALPNTVVVVVCVAPRYVSSWPWAVDHEAFVVTEVWLIVPSGLTT